MPQPKITRKATPAKTIAALIAAIALAPATIPSFLFAQTTQPTTQQGNDASIARLQAQIQSLDRKTQPHAWAEAQLKIAETLFSIALSDPANETRHFQEAVRISQEVLSTSDKEASPLIWANANFQLANAQLELPEPKNSDRAKQLLDIIQTLKKALSVYTPQSTPRQWANATVKTAQARLELAPLVPDQKIKLLLQAINESQTAQDVFAANGNLRDAASAQSFIVAIYWLVLKNDKATLNDAAPKALAACAAAKPLIDKHTRESAWCYLNLVESVAWPAIPTKNNTEKSANLQKAIDACDAVVAFGIKPGILTRTDWMDTCLNQAQLCNLLAFYDTKNTTPILQKSLKATTKLLTVLTRAQDSES